MTTASTAVFTPKVASATQRIERPRVVLKLHDHLQTPRDGDVQQYLLEQELLPLADLQKRIPGVVARPLVNVAHKRVDELVDRARRTDPSYRPRNLFSYLVLDAPPHADLDALAKEARKWPGVELAYVDRPAPDPLVNSADDPLAASQGYLDAAPGGIDARYAWDFAGGDGAGVSVVDMERGWTLTHEDLVAHGAALLGGVLLNTSRNHGTGVLGEIAASDNTLGCVGIVPNVGAINVVSFNGSTRVDAILTAIANLSFGDVLLLEAQVTTDGSVALLGPIEVYDAEFDAIRLATALGIIVVEAGGNGDNGTTGLDLDTYANPAGRRILLRSTTNPDFRDSGAIIVTAATSAAPHTRMPWAPFGRRIDCYAWGENIETCASSDTGATTLYQAGFNGTSGASPIVTGAAVALQGLAQATLGARFSPRQVREILSNPAYGTARAATEATRIGVMPNLRAVITSLMNIAPDVYLRDFVGDSGEPHTGPISASPDIIVLPAAVTNPQASFGAGSSTENRNDLGYEAELGQPNYVYVRVTNQGGAVATDVTATVYWSPVATLVTPDLWQPVGTVHIPSVPTGSVLTVSNAIMWNTVPARGHYCFVGILGTAGDPAPSPGALLSWDNFERFIRDNNNVTWRNFNVVDNDPSVPDPTVPKGFVALPFLAPGAPDRALPMALEVIGKLPAGAKLLLDAPQGFARRAGLGAALLDREQKRAPAPLNPFGRTRTEPMVFRAKERHAMRLLVALPEEAKKHSFDVAVRQLFEGREVGRVTWRLAPGVDRRRAEFLRQQRCD